MSISDDDEEGLIRSPRSQAKRRLSDPEFLDFKTWKEKTCSLIRSENHVMMNNDDELRQAISQAIFLETASKNLIQKRKRQLDEMDKLRVDEGAAGKRLLTENERSVRMMYGPAFARVTNEWKEAFERASRPIDAPDIRRPPPSHRPMPPMRIRPPLPSTFALRPFVPSVNSFSRPLSTTSVTTAMSRAVISPTPRNPFPLISQHLLPPPVRAEPFNFIRSGLKKDVAIENEDPHEHDLKNITSPAFGESTSWRKPYHPVPVPPPQKVFPFVTTSLPPPILQRNAAPALRGSIVENDITSSSTSLASPHSPSSPPGIVGINVHGLYVGNRSRSIPPFAETPRSHP